MSGWNHWSRRLGYRTFKRSFCRSTNNGKLFKKSYQGLTYRRFWNYNLNIKIHYFIQNSHENDLEYQLNSIWLILESKIFAKNLRKMRFSRTRRPKSLHRSRERKKTEEENANLGMAYIFDFKKIFQIMHACMHHMIS